jgi:hypothetical protein
VDNRDTTATGPLLMPEGMFVLHLRSDSAAAQQYLVGRVEHLKSGNSEPFGSLAALLGFIERHLEADAAANLEHPKEGT